MSQERCNDQTRLKSNVYTYVRTRKRCNSKLKFTLSNTLLSSIAYPLEGELIGEMNLPYSVSTMMTLRIKSPCLNAPRRLAIWLFQIQTKRSGINYLFKRSINSRYFTYIVYLDYRQNATLNQCVILERNLIDVKSFVICLLSLTLQKDVDAWFLQHQQYSLRLVSNSSYKKFVGTTKHLVSRIFSPSPQSR